MPFDGIGYISSEPLHKIDAVIDLLSTPDKWCKGALRSHDGRYCIRGAVMSVGATDALEPVILHAIGEVAGRRFRRIESFNDYPNTTHEQIVAVLHRARRRPPPQGVAAEPRRAGADNLARHSIRLVPKLG